MIDCILGDDGVANPGETCSFTCNGGLLLNGSTSRTCQDNGSWSGSDAMCRGMIYTRSTKIENVNRKWRLLRNKKGSWGKP